MRAIFSVIFLLAFCTLANPQSNTDDSLDQWAVFAKSSAGRELLAWIRSGIECEMKGTYFPDLKIKTPGYYGRLGLFITLVKDRAVRGCFGAFDHKSDSLDVTLREYTRSALASDPRYKPVDPDELGSVSVILTVADRPFPINDINEIDISRFGIMICRGENTIILVPAEMRSKDRLNKLIKGADIFAYRAICIK